MNFIVVSEKSVTVMTPNGIALEIYLQISREYEAAVNLRGPLVGWLESAEHYDSVCVFEGTLQECSDFATRFAREHFHPFVEVWKTYGTKLS